MVRQPINSAKFLLWAFVVLSYAISFVDAAVVSPPAGALADAGGRWPYLTRVWRGAWIVEAGFTVAALALTWMVYRISLPHESPDSVTPPRTHEAPN